LRTITGLRKEVIALDCRTNRGPHEQVFVRGVQEHRQHRNQKKPKLRCIETFPTSPTCVKVLVCNHCQRLL
jgi:hypothetical protein